MSEKWESESLEWIHAVRKQSYQKTKGKSLAKLPFGPSAEAEALGKQLRLQRAPLRTEKRTVTKSKAHSK
ncbi:MAG: hypothetical protein ACE5HC_13435 [Candidatus Binatia bacterium]